MSTVQKSGTFNLGSHTVKRLGYGAMQLAGPHVFGPPKDHDAAIAVLREAVASGVNHIDTSDYYGPYVTNQLIREALSPYPEDLVIVTKIGARRGSDASWQPAHSPKELEQAVHDNLRNLGLEVMDVVNLRIMFGMGPPWLDRSATDGACRAATQEPRAPYRPEQRHARAEGAVDRDRLCAEPVQSGAGMTTR